MADNDPKSENGGSVRDKPAAEHHEIALAIETLRAKYESAQQNRTDHDAKTLYWARIAGIGVSIYTLLTLAIVTTARDTETRQLRAYVGVNSEPITLNCNACDDPSKPLTEIRDGNYVVMEIQNFGLTPAYDTTVRLKWEINASGTGPASDFTYPDDQLGNRDKGKFPMYPGQKRSNILSLDAQTVGLIRRAQKHEISLFYYGRVDYRDVFDEEPTTDFCFQFAPDAGPKYHFPLCFEHNAPRPRQ